MFLLFYSLFLSSEVSTLWLYVSDSDSDYDSHSDTGSNPDIGSDSDTGSDTDIDIDIDTGWPGVWFGADIGWGWDMFWYTWYSMI